MGNYIYTQENSYKILSRWYLTPHRLHKMFPNTPSNCWRCNDNDGSFLHIWWSCPKIQEFWKTIHRYTQQISKIFIEFSPAQLLLHHSFAPRKLYFKSLAMHMINAAKLCIPCHWKSPELPSVKEWLLRIKKIAEMEELIHRAKDSPQTFNKTWACWHHFTSSDEFKQLQQ